MLDRALRLTFRNYGTLALLAGAMSFPASLIYCYVYRKTITLGELHGTILAFPGSRQVSGVGHDTLVTARVIGWGLVALGVLLLPLLVRATRRILERDAEGHAPTVPDAIRSRPAGTPSLLPPLRRSGPQFLISTAVALVVGWLALEAGLRLAELLSDRRLWVGVGAARALGWAVGVPFVLVPWALSSRP
jgi:hypothetical protein